MYSDMIPNRHRHEEAYLFDYCIAKDINGGPCDKRLVCYWDTEHLSV